MSYNLKHIPRTYISTCRAACGFGSGINMSSNFLLLNEITLVRWRGAYGNLNAFSINLGFLFGLVAGGLAPFQWCIPSELT